MSNDFITKLKSAFESGLLLFAKYGLIFLLVYIILNMFSNVLAGSNNGTNAILYLNQAIEKGYLPKAVNGSLPDRPKDEKTP